MDQSATPDRVTVRPRKPITQMSEAERRELAKEIIDRLGLSNPPEQPSDPPDEQIRHPSPPEAAAPAQEEPPHA